MKFRVLLSAVVASLSLALGAQVTTSDIPRWYATIDKLYTAGSYADSLRLVENMYLQPGSEGLKRFAKARDLTPERLLGAIKAYPKFYASIRKDALNLAAQEDSIYAALLMVEAVLPAFKIPKVTIAFGIMNTGGTTSGNQILLGAGMVSATANADTSELSTWQRSVSIPAEGTKQDIRTIVAHEAVHTRQRRFLPSKSLEVKTIYEGVCDFVVYDLLNFEVESQNHRFGESRECDVWKAFEADLSTPKGQEKVQWLYGGDHSNHDFPADMGYFVGRRIAATYYQQAIDKELALNELLDPKKYKRIFQVSGYAGRCE